MAWHRCNVERNQHATGFRCIPEDFQIRRLVRYGTGGLPKIDRWLAPLQASDDVWIHVGIRLKS